MKVSTSTKNIHEKILNKNTNDNELKKGIKKRCSLQDDIYKNEIFKIYMKEVSLITFETFRKEK